jgi:Domain of unknown function (DUF1844)
VSTDADNDRGPDEPGASFSDFLLWLATMAAVQFGDLPDPATGETVAPNVAAAGQLVAIIGMLQEKTAGNLAPHESKLIDELLYELRMRFVQAQQGDKRIITP